MNLVNEGNLSSASILKRLIPSTALSCIMMKSSGIRPKRSTGSMTYRGTSLLGNRTRSGAIPTESDVPTTTNTSASLASLAARSALSGNSSKNTTAGRS